MPTVDELLDEAQNTDDDDLALSKYLAALELDFNDSRIHYNIGLIHKYRGQWRDSFRYNKRALELDSISGGVRSHRDRRLPGKPGGAGRAGSISAERLLERFRRIDLDLHSDHAGVRRGKLSVRVDARKA